MLTRPTPAQIERVVHDKIGAVLEERFGEIRPFGGADKLNATLGLGSLDLAFIVAELELELGVDPFAKLVPITSIRSADDLVKAYREALFPETQAASQDQTLAAAAQRGRGRRARRGRK